MYANNIYHLIEHFWDKEKAEFNTDTADEIMRGCLLTKDGEIVHPHLKSATA